MPTFYLIRIKQPINTLITPTTSRTAEVNKFDFDKSQPSTERKLLMADIYIGFLRINWEGWRLLGAETSFPKDLHTEIKSVIFHRGWLVMFIKLKTRE